MLVSALSPPLGDNGGGGGRLHNAVFSERIPSRRREKGGGRVFQVDAFMRQRTSLPLKSWSLLLHFSPSSIRKPPAGSSAYSGVSGRDVEPPPFVYVVISWQQESRLSRLSLPLFFFFFHPASPHNRLPREPRRLSSTRLHRRLRRQKLSLSKRI